MKTSDKCTCDKDPNNCEGHRCCPSHCCSNSMSCKYCYDDCPVATGKIPGEFKCEYCYEEEKRQDEMLSSMDDRDLIYEIIKRGYKVSK